MHPSASPHTLMDFHTLISKLASPIVKNKDKFVSFDLCVSFSRKKKKLALTYIRLQRRMLQYTKNYDCHTQLLYKQYLVVWVSHQFINSLLYKCGFSSFFFFFFFLDSTQSPSGIKEPGSPKSFVPVVWWTGLVSP